jgi:glucans biosynthesis protein
MATVARVVRSAGSANNSPTVLSFQRISHVFLRYFIMNRLLIASRFSTLAAGMLGGLALLAASTHTTWAFGFADVESRALRLSQAPYREEPVNVPAQLRDIDYAHYTEIRFKPEQAYWRDARLPFELEFFHEGYRFNQPVALNEVSGSRVRRIDFNPDAFDYGPLNVDRKSVQGLGYAGFRVHYAVNTPKYKDEVLVFLGASYFRAVGKGQRYGLSARGLAVDTALSSGEEFPRFVEFWIERPASAAKTLTIYGLLDSKRVTGAYRFIVTPGIDTVMDVKARLYWRAAVGKLGIAPLTSMFLFGSNQHGPDDDYRPQVHDSDGLSIHTGADEWIWRPLVNPRRLLVTSFGVTNPKGFGLMQRDRSYDDYQDMDSRYEMRPGAWVEPRGQWGAGHIELMQIPVPDESNDNISAYWVPDHPPPTDRPFDIEYRVLWSMHALPPVSSVVQTRIGYGYRRPQDGSLQYIVDFSDAGLARLNGPPEADVTADSNARVVERTLRHNDANRSWRLALRLLRVDAKNPVELRASLRSGKTSVSEIWSYIIPPE